MKFCDTTFLAALRSHLDSGFLERTEAEYLQQDWHWAIIPSVEGELRRESQFRDPVGMDLGLFSVRSAAKSTGLSDRHIRRAIRDGKLDCLHAGRRILIEREAILRWLRRVN